MNKRLALHNQRGETIVEVIVSSVLVVIAVAGFATCAIAAGSINARISEREKLMYENIAAAEAREGSPTSAAIRMTVNGGTLAEVDVDVYGAEMKTFAYQP